jgi:hypothetical protein
LSGIEGMENIYRDCEGYNRERSVDEWRENEGDQKRFIRIQKRIQAGYESELREAGLKGGYGKI